MAEKTSSSASDAGAGAKDVKRREFPRYPVKRAGTIAGNILKEGTSVARARICGNLGISDTSSKTDSLFAAARRYELLTEESNGFLSASDLGARVCSDDQLTRMLAIAEANSNFEPYAKFIERFTEKTLPKMGAAQDLIVRDFGIPQTKAKLFCEVLMENVQDAGLIDDLPGGRVLRAQPYVPTTETDDGEEGADEVEEAVPPPNTPERKAIDREPSGRAVEMHFNIQLHLPETTEPQVYDAIFKSMKDHLLGS